MEPDVTAAFIALAGVLISAAVSWVVGRRSAATELRKQQLQLFQAYAEGLQQRRLATYPEAYALISACAKEIHRGTITIDYLRSTLDRFQAWDSMHSLLLSHRTSSIVHTAQWALDGLVKQGAEALTPAVLEQARETIGRVELALKEDIGVFAVEYEENRKLEYYLEEDTTKSEERKHPASPPPA